MDEAEKYTQRLQAITRKSLRDQWLMDGPSSPTSSEPRSPLWGSQVQEMEQRIDKLQTESQRLAEEEEKLEQQMEDGRANAVVVEATAEAVQAVILENGQEEVEAESVLGTVEAALLERAEILTNGRGEGEGQAATHDASEEGGPPNGTNGPVTVVPEDGAITMTFLGFTEAEPVLEEGGVIMMRAERVIINDEGDELANDLSSTGQEQDVDSVASNKSSESPEEGGIEEAKPETTPEESSEVAKETEAAADTVTGDLGEGQMDTVTRDLGEGQMHTVTGDLGEGQMEGVANSGGEEEAQPVEEAPVSDLQVPDDGVVAAVPVYSESLLTPRPDAEGEAAGEPAEGDVEVKTEVEVKGEEAASVSPESAILPGGQFLEVSLVEPRTEADPEQEPLLFPSKAQTLEQAPAAPETLTATRGEAEGGVGVAPKRQTCQCCAVM
ncbi:paralemmin-3-like isoform X2 [Salvelinus fontinalis]|uniref:paralemmin-3-like isoform X2 n=1 Tax=Salvelinus fontinalis TaxID=8038 RepID=UPI0024853FE9|nr:paralemmin-3-like isoform X2 [Salvelinus fontinalis]